MPLITLDKISLAFGHVALLDHVNFTIEPGERVCLVGRNGEGKSTFMRVIHGDVKADDGSLWIKPELRVAMLQQEVPTTEDSTVFDVIAGGLQKAGKLISEFHHITHDPELGQDNALMQRMGELQQQLDACDGWALEQRVESVITRLELPADKLMSALSGGYKRRVLLARALVSDPDLLLLDEPTNHLDIEGIQWLEDFLKSYNGALLFITHDRAFLQRLATRIIELDRGKLTSWPGDYQNYKVSKQHMLDVEADQNAKFDKKLAQEEVWIRQGIKARRTRNEGRARALKSLRLEHGARRNQQEKAKIELDSGDRSGKLVAEVKNANCGYEGVTLIRDFSTRIMRGDRIGIIGPNGVGKSTLIKLMLGDLQPDSGNVRLGTKLQIAYFDQQRAVLDPEKSVIDNLNQGSSTVTINGREKHAIGYLQDFLFPPQRVRSPVKSLSGGERNRLLLARLFCRPANLLVMDEPTNDLDVETLELLEELLLDFDGTLLLVSHDREFLDNVVTSSLVFEENGHVGEYVGGYTDWQHQTGGAVVETQDKVAGKTAGKTADKTIKNKTVKNNSTDASPVKQNKTSYKDQREMQQLTQKIEKLEAEKSSLEASVSQVDFYQLPQSQTTETLDTLQQTSKQLDEAYARWEALESR